MSRYVLLLAAVLAPILPASAQQFSFAVVGDTQNSGTLNHDVFPQIIEDIDALDPAFSLFCGDLIGGFWDIGTHQAAWEEWVTVASALDGEIYAVPGNHDFFPGASVPAAWLETFHWLPTANSPPGEEGMSYHFDYLDTRVISVLSDSAGGQTLPDMAWLQGVLDDPDTLAAEHVFVFSHHPVSFSEVEPLGNTGSPFWQSLLGAGVDAFFAGHWHRYQPSQLGNGGDTWEAIVGTGGGPEYDPTRPYQQLHGFLLVTVDGATATAQFFGDADEDGHYDDVMDEFVIAQPGPAPRGLVARYSFDDETASDSAPAPLGRSVHGAFMNDAAVVDDPQRGPSLQLDGDLDGVEAGAIGDHVLSINGDVSLSFWARATEAGSGDWGGAMLAYGTCDYYCEDEETNYSYWISLVQGDHLMAFWEYEDGTNVTVTSTEPVPGGAADTWHHFAVVRDTGEQRVYFYVDGVDLGDPVPYDREPTGGGRGMLYIGRDVRGSDGYEFAGRIDEVCIYDVLLELGSIEELAGGADCELHPDDVDDDDDDSADDDDATPGDDDDGDDDTTSDDDDDGWPGRQDDDDTEDGCGCRVGPNGRPVAVGGLLLAAGLLALRRRR